MTKGSDNVFPKLLVSLNTSDPAAPSDSSWKVYAKSGGIYARSSNAIAGPFAASSGSSSFVGARVFNSATQSINDSTITAVTFDSESYDTSSIHDTGSNTSRLTASATGYWRLTGGTTWDSNTTNLRYLWWRIDGTTEVDGGMVTGSPAATSLAQITTVTLSLTSGQYVELIAYQTSGGARDIGGTSADKKFESWAEAHYLGT